MATRAVVKRQCIDSFLPDARVRVCGTFCSGFAISETWFRTRLHLLSDPRSCISRGAPPVGHAAFEVMLKYCSFFPRLIRLPALGHLHRGRSTLVGHAWLDATLGSLRDRQAAPLSRCASGGRTSRLKADACPRTRRRHMTSAVDNRSRKTAFAHVNDVNGKTIRQLEEITPVREK